jgi:hypothetical protein
MVPDELIAMASGRIPTPQSVFDGIASLRHHPKNMQAYEAMQQAWKDAEEHDPSGKVDRRKNNRQPKRKV